jgi:tight adherence protein B
MEATVNNSIMYWSTFAAIFSVFGIGALYLIGRKRWTEELHRLEKHQKKMEEKAALAAEDSENIFLQEKTDYLGKLLSQAGMEAKYKQMKNYWVMSSIGGSVVLVILPLVFGAPELSPFGFVFGLGAGAFGFIAYLKYLVKGRQDKMTAQLPQVLESMVSSLKAGSPVVECFKLLAETAPDPIRGEFKRALVSLQLGKPFRDVMHEMSTRIRTPDFRLLTQAIFISQDVGANLADVVAVIADAIRARFRLRDFLNSLTAQGKATAVFIGCLPYFITGMTLMITPGYITPFLNHPVARIVFIGLMIWEFIGAWILVKMTTFEV